MVPASPLRRVAPAILTLTLLAACSERPTEVRRIAPRDVRASDVAPEGVRYLVLARGNGFGRDFESDVAALGGTVESVHDGVGFAVVSGLTSDAAARLAGDARVADVEADAIVALDEHRAPAMPDVAAVADPGITSATNPATALFASWQWNMRAIRADAAWSAGKLGSPSVTVAIIDSGIDYDDPDLAGLVDLTRSASFSASDNAVRAKFFAARNVISDFNGHGTNVAAQVSSNAVVFGGVTSRTRLIGVKVLGANGRGSIGDILNGVLWAADHGANVANMSLGGTFLKTGAGRLTSLLNRVFNYAKKQGMLIVVAAGNDAENLDHNGNEASTFCDMPHVVCVAAMGPTTVTGAVDVPAYYTNFGRSAISVAGPGGNADPNLTVSAWPWGADFASWVWSFCSKTTITGFAASGAPVVPCAAGNRITGFIGTSQASPHVAGLAALIMGTSGSLVPSQVKNAISKSADDVGQPGTDPFFGAGRINVAKALGIN